MAWSWFVDLPDPENPSGPWVNVAADAGRLDRAVAYAQAEYGADEDGDIDVVFQDTDLDGGYVDYFRVVIPNPWVDGEGVELFGSDSRDEVVAWVKENLGGEEGWIGLVSEIQADESSEPGPSERKRWRPR